MFAEAGVRATFFTLGCVAERHKGLVRAIADAGHEVASHGWEHYRVGDQTPGGVPRRCDPDEESCWRTCRGRR